MESHTQERKLEDKIANCYTLNGNWMRHNVVAKKNRGTCNALWHYSRSTIINHVVLMLIPSHVSRALVHSCAYLILYLIVSKHACFHF